MCRIAGLASKALPLAAIEEMVQQMCKIQQHGGPDDLGLHTCTEGNLVMGHRRLALIDLSQSGHQPMVYQDRYIITFNGEIYNFLDLKRELMQMGMCFNTHSDTEVILAAFAKWHTQSFTRLRGMYAFALYDKRERHLYLVRDPSGIKPLYYSVTNTVIEFASEIRAFTVSKDKRENVNWPVFQLAYGHVPEPVTIFQNIIPLHKGCFYKYNLSSGEGSLQSFTHYSYSNTINDETLCRETIRRTLKDSVIRHLMSDVPIGVLLSGGIDSSIIAALCHASEGNRLKTLSLYFKEEQFSEKKYQDRIIEKFQCKCYQQLLTASEFDQSLPDIINAMDMPSSDGVNTWFISKYAKIYGLKSVLSGIGGDELFGGYPSFGRLSFARSLQKAPSSLFHLFKRSEINKLNRLPYLSLDGIKGLYLFLRGQFTPLQIASQLGASEEEIWTILQEQPILPVISGLVSKNQASWMELNMYMQNQLLRDSDVMSMAHGIEIRVPFLDHEFVRTVLSIDPSIKFQGVLSKQLLIDTFKDELPEAVWNRKKMGFSFPFRQWLNSSSFVRDVMEGSNKSALLSYQKFKNGKLHWSHLMSLVILQVLKVS